MGVSIVDALNISTEFSGFAINFVKLFLNFLFTIDVYLMTHNPPSTILCRFPYYIITSIKHLLYKKVRLKNKFMNAQLLGGEISLFNLII